MKGSSQLSGAFVPMTNTQKKIVEYDLEERLLDFAVRIIEIVEALPNTRTGNHIAGQLLRCGTSPAPNYGEAQSAESRKDFVHKMKVCLKELRETKRALKLTKRVPLVQPPSLVDPLLAETEELIKIFFVSIRTANKNVAREGTAEPYGDGL